MLKTALFVTIILISTFTIFAQNQTEAQTLKQYQESVASNPQNEMINLVEEISTISPLSENTLCFVRKPVANHLKKIQDKLNQQGFAMVVDNCYSPVSVLTNDDAPFIQSRGCSVVVLLKDIETNDFVYGEENRLEKIMNQYGFTKTNNRWDMKIWSKFELLNVTVEDFKANAL